MIDGDNLETFPSIINSPSSTTSVSSPNSRSTPRGFASTGYGPGPALPPSSYLSSTLPTATTNSSTAIPTTLISASSNSNFSMSQPSESVATSTVSGSLTTLTITSGSASQSQGAATSEANKVGSRNAIIVGTTVVLGLVGVAGVGHYL